MQGAQDTHREWEVSVVLEEDRDRSTKFLELQRADVMSVYEDIALVRVIQPHCEFEDSAFPCAVGANDDLVRGKIIMKMRK